jgi:hypothetical protein
MDDRKYFFEDVCIPRNEFIKEHIKLLQLLRQGDRTQLLAEAKDQEAELQQLTGGGGETKDEAINMSNRDWNMLTNVQQRELNAIAKQARAARIALLAARVLGKAKKRHGELGDVADSSYGMPPPKAAVPKGPKR